MRLRDRLQERGLAASGNDAGEGVLAVRTSCLYPCNLGPLMVVHPDGAWYGALNEGAVDRIVDEHLGQGRPVAAHLRFRPSEAPPSPAPAPAGAGGA